MKIKIKLLVVALTLVSLYVSGRLYFHFTDGFSIENISSIFPASPERTTRVLSEEEKKQIDAILSQEFTYLGKGCQSYVFLSADKKYVLKFFKYQRFKIQPWMENLAFIPAINAYWEKKVQHKNEKLRRFFVGWKIAFDELQQETGLVFVHLNKSNDLQKTLTFYDKMGFKHQVNLDDMEFMVQKKADMLCPTLKTLIKNEEIDKAKILLTDIIALIASDYKKGFADHDHALMQNTGVLNDKPIHIDVGQFAKDETAKDIKVFKQHLFNKMYKFSEWLGNESPELKNFLEKKLVEVIGQDYFTMQPHFIPHDEK